MHIAGVSLVHDKSVVTREDLAKVLWARLLDKAPLTLNERQVIAGFQKIVCLERDAITDDYRARCRAEVFGG